MLWLLLPSGVHAWRSRHLPNQLPSLWKVRGKKLLRCSWIFVNEENKKQSSMLMILFSVLNKIRHLICGNKLNWLLNLNLVYKKPWTGARNGLLISMLVTINWFRLTSLLTLVLLMWKWMGLFLKLVSTIFYQVFIFSTKWHPFKNYEVFFISSKKIFSFSRYSIFCNFFTSFPHFADTKGQMEVE